MKKINTKRIKDVDLLETCGFRNKDDLNAKVNANHATLLPEVESTLRIYAENKERLEKLGIVQSMKLRLLTKLSAGQIHKIAKKYGDQFTNRPVHVSDGYSYVVEDGFLFQLNKPREIELENGQFKEEASGVYIVGKVGLPYINEVEFLEGKYLSPDTLLYIHDKGYTYKTSPLRVYNGEQLEYVYNKEKGCFEKIKEEEVEGNN